MIETLRRIATHTARGIFTHLLWKGGSATRQELLASGYTSTVLHEAILSLEAAGFIIKIGGTYRVTTFAPPKDSFGIPKDEESFGIPKEVSPDRNIEQITEQLEPKKSFGMPKQSFAPPKDSFAPPKLSVNVVNNVINKTKLTNVSPLISSTGELEAFIDGFQPDEKAKYLKIYQVVVNLVGFQCAPDLYQRIAVIPYVGRESRHQFRCSA